MSGRAITAGAVAALLVVAVVAAPVAAAPAPYALVELARTPGGTPIDVADPDVIKVGDTWYLYGTSSGAGFETWSSTDLETWSYEGLVWEPTPGSWADDGYYWAPDLHVDADGYWLYYTAGQRIGVARADSPLGPFVDQLDHELVGGGHGGVDGLAIDAFLLEASDGSLTLYFSMYPLFAVIAAQPMLDHVTPAPGPPTVVLDASVNSWEGLVREAPWVIEHDGQFHLMYSGNGANLTCYAVGDAVGPTPLGPFTRRADNPILHDDLDAGFYGPGHHSVVEGPGGGLVMVFHTKTDPEPGWPRRVRTAPMSFDADGRIVMDAPPPGDGAPGHTSCPVAIADPEAPTDPAPPSSTTSTTAPTVVATVVAPTFTG